LVVDQTLEDFSPRPEGVVAQVAPAGLATLRALEPMARIGLEAGIVHQSAAVSTRAVLCKSLHG
jgi:hypothetical protein